jgi:DNA-binding transcriptional LysR family regulator
VGLFASREYIRRRGQPRRLGDLARHDCVLFRARGGRTTWQLLDGEREQKVEVTGPLEVDEIPSAHQAVVAGVGIGPISFLLSARMPNLVRVLPKYVFPDIPVSLVWPGKRLQPASVVLFRDFLAARLASLGLDA